jgi:PAS domain S-box-containing protein
MIRRSRKSAKPAKKTALRTTTSDSSRYRQLVSDRIESEARYRLLLESTNEAVIIIDSRTGRITDCNDCAAGLLGRSSQELLGLHQSEIHPSGERDKYPAMFRRIATTRKYFRFECLFRCGNGTDMWTKVRARAFRAGGRKYILATFYNITLRKRAEEAMRDHEARFLNLLEHIPDIAVQGYDTNGVVRYWNKASEKVYGYSAAEAVGRNLDDLIIPPDIKPLFRQALGLGAAATRSGELMPPTECLLLRKDGTLTPVYSIHTVVCLEGKEPEMFCLDVDLSQRKLAEEALRRSENLLSSIIEQSPIATWICDAQGTTIRQNAASRRLFGIDRDEQTIGKYNLFKDPLLRDQGHLEAVRRVFADGHTARFTLDYDLSKVDCVQVPHATRRLLQTTLFPIKDTDGRLVDAVVQHEDVTELRNAEDRLRQAQKMEAIGKLAGGIAHDFNNQLTVIKGYCDLMLQNMPHANPLREPIEQILKAATRSISMTIHLLAYSREQVLRPEVINLNAVLTDMVGALRQLLGGSITLSMNLEEDLGEVRADPAGVQQAITNIVVNARDAMPKGGQLTIRTAEVLLDADYARDRPDVSAGPHVMMAFRDTGIGMDDATLQRIFDPFYTTKALGQGTGLGLSMVYGFVKQSGGHIDVASQVGQGSTFCIFLPLLPHRERGKA